MLRRYGATLAGKVDFDELYQDAFVKIVHILETRVDLVETGYLEKYITVSVEHQIIDKIRYLKVRRGTVSLDEPLLDDASLTLADLLPSPYSAEPVRVVLAKERLEELRLAVVGRKHPGTRRMLSEMYDTVQAQAAEC
jgi:DNA-directed RNA polymerase specialized sigma24 family protein